MTDPLRNPKDPLHNVLDLSAVELLRRLSPVCNSFPVASVIDAAMALVIEAIRQNKTTWPEAESAMQEISGRTMQALLDHYDTGGRKKGIFPYDQVIAVPWPVAALRPGNINGKG